MKIPFRIIGLTFLFQAITIASFCQKNKKTAEQQYIDAVNISVSNELQKFPDHEDGSKYFISLCADVPNNKKPKQVAYHQQTGHVFLILQMIGTSNDTTSQVFGFYPKRGLPTLLFKTIKSVIKDNSRREHDAVITKELDRLQFDTVVNKSIDLAGKIYHINKFNCYDYAVMIYNSVAEVDVPISHVKFPFIFGKGGSPVGLYLDLEKMKTTGSGSGLISFGNFKAPYSSTRVVQK